MYVTDFNKMYMESEEGKTMNRQEYGMFKYNAAVNMHKRGLITKRDFNEYRNQIEEQLFFDYLHKKKK